VADSRPRKAAIRKAPKKGTSVGSGGQRRRQLEGRGPTPAAEQRSHHPAAKRADKAARSAQGAGGSRRTGASRSAAPRTGGRPGAPRASGTGRAPAPRRGNRDAVEVVAGRNAVLEALTAGLVPDTVYVAERLETDDRVRAILKLCTQRGLPVLEAPRAELDRLTGDAVHQGVALAVQPYAYRDPSELREAAVGLGSPVVVALDGVLDPHNLGAVARSAAAFGAVGLLLPERRSAGVTAGAWKASAGALARIPVARVTNLTRALGDFADEGWTIVGLAGEAEGDVAHLATVLPGALDGPLVLVAGAEGKGLARLTRERCDALVSVPIDAATESLNVSVATAIALYELRRAHS
jgi:23S rRNA (guanosine2251-2'-O)-methyltransferase